MKRALEAAGERKAPYADELRSIVPSYPPTIFISWLEECWCCGGDVDGVKRAIDSYLYSPRYGVVGRGTRAWERRWMHWSCAARYYRVDKCPMTDLATMKQQRSGQMLLLLLEAGLTYDVAWPITAVACWLLA